MASIRKCSHFPKQYKKIGILNDSNYEVLVCDSCRHDPDFTGFKEEVLQN